VSFLLYNLLLWTLFVLGAPVWLTLVALRPKWRAGLWERLGAVPSRLRVEPRGKPVVWVHAVSVGEVLAAASLIKELQRDCEVFVSTTTLTGQTLAQNRFGLDRVFYFPVDLGFAVRAYLRRLQPQAIVLLETEFWPNFLRIAHQKAKVAVVNARISDRSLPGYQRWGGFVSRVLDNVDLFLAQSEEDARRLVKIGASAERVQVGGNLKFDWTPPAEPHIVNSLREQIQGQQLFPVLVAGSTVEGEETVVANSFRKVVERYPKALLILAPRHPERFAEAREAVSNCGFAAQRRSMWNGTQLAPGVFLLDSIGELASLYRVADIAFVGGSLVPRGGHNVLEPAYFGKPVTVGPYTENFRDIVSTFSDGKALIATTVETLSETWLRLAASEAERFALGERARAVMQANVGATARTVEAIRQFMEQP
jgi:3-deoxy-D-manno-octulosonic-acid transferase